MNIISLLACVFETHHNKEKDQWIWGLKKKKKEMMALYAASSQKRFKVGLIICEFWKIAISAMQNFPRRINIFNCTFPWLLYYVVKLDL